ncbi:MAG TPA: 2Fe-2S iron-sulfur cluster-binding protein [Candidatus Limnocylindrales bacterium]|nr:2Fe-2S iron-sulfur cluster-binding protein [Candidatus Limnocylindrales bacterium]
MPTITLRDGTRIEAPAGKRLVLALEDGGVDILHRCGGFARCTTCRVEFLDGEPERMTAAEHDRLQARELLGLARLSCQITCENDMRLQVLQTVSTTDLEDPGPRPEDQITPPPVWDKAPPPVPREV